MKIVKISGMILPLLLCAAMQANAVIIDFESLVHDDTSIIDHGASYIEDGFLLENLATVDSSGNEPSFATYGKQLDGFTGSTSLINDNYRGVTRLSSLAGYLFSVYSIDVSELAAGVSESITFYGEKSDTTVVSQIFTIDGAFGSQTFYFNTSFYDLVTLEWAQTDYFVQVDNINAVPEPSTMLLLGVGLTAFAAAGRSQKKQS